MSTSRGADFDALGCGKQHKTLQTFPSTSSGLLCKQHSADLIKPVCPVCSEIRDPGLISLIIQAICLLISKCREKLGFKGLILQRVSLGRTPRLSSSRTPGWGWMLTLQALCARGPPGSLTRGKGMQGFQVLPTQHKRSALPMRQLQVIATSNLKSLPRVPRTTEPHNSLGWDKPQSSSSSTQK